MPEALGNTAIAGSEEETKSSVLLLLLKTLNKLSQDLICQPSSLYGESKVGIGKFNEVIIQQR